MTDRVLTAKGSATRDRILGAAAELFYEHGVRQTSNEAIRQAAQVSGSQLNHYFADREQLVKAVIARRAEAAADPSRFPGLGAPATLAALRAWADDYVDGHSELLAGCRVGSIAGETLKSDYHTQDEVAAAFDGWRATYVAGLEALREAGVLRADADAARLATVLLAGIQGGLLLAQVSQSAEPLRIALDAAVDEVERSAA